MKKKKDLNELIEQALENAVDDRSRAKQYVEKLEAIFDVNPKQVSELDGAMLVGGHLTKLLEQMSRANEQIVKLAQIKEKEDARTDKSKEDRQPINLADLTKDIDEEQLEEFAAKSYKLRVADE